MLLNYSPLKYVTIHKGVQTTRETFVRNDVYKNLCVCSGNKKIEDVMRSPIKVLHLTHVSRNLKI